MMEQHRLNSQMSNSEDDSFFKILIATDCHLGYEETDPVIGEDSFVTFEEILTKAVDEDVDFILLGGDLFHHNNPSQKTMNKCIELLREFSLGCRPVKFELLSRAANVLSHSFSQTFNFLDENINVSIPVFTIHGNHDDPSGLGQYSSLDTLSSAGLVTYFGKWTDLNEVIVRPIVMRKNCTYLALYGLSHIKDDRLCRLFIDQKVVFLEPEYEPRKCIRILVLHQNRADRGPKRFISESFIPSFFDMVIWGHEHDCEVEPLWNIEKEFYVTQPGSTVATSLCEGEARPKHIAILQLWRDYMQLDPVRLNTVRPFVWKSVRLMDVGVPMKDEENREAKSEAIAHYCMQQVEQMIREAFSLATGHPRQPKLPLIRLRCEYSDESQLFNAVKFGQRFSNRVATPNLEIIRFKKIVETFGKRVQTDRAKVISTLKDLYRNKAEESQNFSECVNRIVNDYFTEHPENKLDVLNLAEMTAAVEKFIDKDETDIISEVVDRRLKKVITRVTNSQVQDLEGVDRELEILRGEEEQKEAELDAELSKTIGKKPETAAVPGSGSETDEYDPDEPMSPSPGRGERKLTGSREEKLNRIITIQSDSESSESDVNGVTATADNVRVTARERGRGGPARGGRGRGTGAKKPTVTVELKSPKRSATARSKEMTRKPLTFAVNNTIVYEDDDSD